MKSLGLRLYIVMCFISATILLWSKVLEFSDIPFTLISIFAVGILFYVENLAHKRRLQHWGVIREKGKGNFILFHFVLYRGAMISVVILLILATKVTVGLIVVCSVLPLLAITALAGLMVWKECESAYEIATLRSAAETVKIMRN